MISHSFLDPPSQAHRYQNPSVQAVASYTFVGRGGCRDASNLPYDYYRKSGVATNADCATACEGIGKDGRRGFYRSYLNICRCLFENGVVTYPTPDGFDDFFSFYSGIGEIASSNGDTGRYCYKIDVSNLLLVHPMEV